jgi:nucleoside-diphosphate-sugar epimerase
MPIENVLVTGGTGRLGRFVVDELKRHYRVAALDRDAATAPDLAVDVRDLPRLVDAMRGQHAVVHLAAIDSSVPAPAAAVFDTNVRGTWNVLEAAHATGVQHVVICSSASPSAPTSRILGRRRSTCRSTRRIRSGRPRRTGSASSSARRSPAASRAGAPWP